MSGSPRMKERLTFDTHFGWDYGLLNSGSRHRLADQAGLTYFQKAYPSRLLLRFGLLSIAFLHRTHRKMDHTSVVLSNNWTSERVCASLRVDSDFFWGQGILSAKSTEANPELPSFAQLSSAALVFKGRPHSAICRHRRQRLGVCELSHLQGDLSPEGFADCHLERLYQWQ